MTEQIITKNLYSLMSPGGGGNTSTNYTYITLMPNTLSRDTDQTTSNPFWTNFKNRNISNIGTNYFLNPTHFSKALSEMTESEIYGAITSSPDGGTQTVQEIKDSSTGLTTGLKFIKTYINNTNNNITINGVTLKLKYTDAKNYTRYCNLVLNKFDGEIIVHPAESYQFTLDLDNIFISLPSTIGS